MANAKRYDNYINGEWVAGGDYSTNINPSELTDAIGDYAKACLLYTSPSPRDGLLSRMPSSA